MNHCVKVSSSTEDSCRVSMAAISTDANHEVICVFRPGERPRLTRLPVDSVEFSAERVNGGCNAMLIAAVEWNIDATEAPGGLRAIDSSFCTSFSSPKVLATLTHTSQHLFGRFETFEVWREKQRVRLTSWHFLFFLAATKLGETGEPTTTAVPHLGVRPAPYSNHIHLAPSLCGNGTSPDSSVRLCTSRILLVTELGS
jgi:hypothetical protein